jgi:hypothetical protein
LRSAAVAQFRAQQRVKWGGDIEMDWIVSLACCYLTARRISHENGDYQRAYEDAIDRGLIDRPSRGTASPGPCVNADDPGFYRATTHEDANPLDRQNELSELDGEEPGASSLLSWQHREQHQLLAYAQARDSNDRQNEQTRASNDAATRAYEELVEIGDFELPLLTELEDWDARDEEDAINQEDGAVQDLDEDSASPEDAPLLPDGMNVDEYVKTHGDIDVSGYINRFKFDPHNPLDAMRLVEQLDASDEFDDERWEGTSKTLDDSIAYDDALDTAAAD